MFSLFTLSSFIHLSLECDSTLKYSGVFDNVTSNVTLSSHKWCESSSDGEHHMERVSFQINGKEEHY